MPNRRQAIICTNDGPGHCRIYSSPGINGIKLIITFLGIVRLNFCDNRIDPINAIDAGILCQSIPYIYLDVYSHNKSNK